MVVVPDARRRDSVEHNNCNITTIESAHGEMPTRRLCTVMSIQGMYQENLQGAPLQGTPTDGTYISKEGFARQAARFAV